MPGRLLSLSLVTGAYVACISAAYLSLQMLPHNVTCAGGWLHPATPFGPLLAVLWGDIVATVVIWLFSLIFDNSSFYDPYWSVIPVARAAYLVSLSNSQAVSGRTLLCVGSLCFWALRLTINWIRGWTGLQHEDWRYVEMRGWFPAGCLGRAVYWVVGSFGGIHMFPTLMVWLANVPLYPALVTGTAPLSVWDYVAFAICIAAATLQFVADEQMRAFRRRPNKGKEACMEEGVWRFCRRPNYLGELSFWWGQCLFAYAAEPSSMYFAIWGAIVIHALFVFASGPWMDRRQLARRPTTFRNYMSRTTTMFLPWPPAAKGEKTT